MAMLINPYILGDPWDPNSVSGLAAWWDAQDNTTIDLASGTDTWMDKSGNSLHLSQASEPLRPTKVMVDGRQMLSFSQGAGQYLARPNTALLDFAGDFTLFCVYHSADGNRGSFVFKGDAVRYQMRLHTGTADGHLLMAIDDDTTAQLVDESAVAYNDDVVRLVTGMRDGTNLRMYVDGSEAAASPTAIGSYGSLENAQQFFVGTEQGLVNHLDGEIGEVLIYGNAVSGADLDYIHDGLAARWGL